VGPKRAEQLDQTLQKLNATHGEHPGPDGALRQPRAGPTAELQATLLEFRTLAAKLDSTISAPAIVRARDKADTLVGNLNEMSVQFRATGERLDSVLAKLERGEGTMGKLATDTVLYQRFTDLSASVDSLVRDCARTPAARGHGEDVLSAAGARHDARPDLPRHRRRDAHARPQRLGPRAGP